MDKIQEIVRRGMELQAATFEACAHSEASAAITPLEPEHERFLTCLGDLIANNNELIAALLDERESGG